jgi:hypothetical protein
MKKFAFLALASLLIAFSASAQKSITFKYKYLPGRTYSGTMGMTLNCNAVLKGDTQLIEKLKSQGINQPVTLTMAMKMVSDTKTGSADANKVFPFTMSYKMENMSFKVGSNAIPMPANANSGVNIFGHVAVDGKLKADSITSNAGKLKDTSDKTVTKLINSFQNIIKFPEKPMHIGDTFTQDMPLNMPMTGNGMDIKAKSIYKLVSIADGKAYFDITQSMDVTIPVKGQPITLTGTGTGKLIFDLKNSFPTQYVANIDLKFSGKINTLEINGTATMNMDYINVIN